MVIELGLEIGVGKHLMDGIFHVPRPLIQPGADPFLDLNGRQAEHDPNEYKPMATSIMVPRFMHSSSM